jgi:CysZ protein
MPEHTGFMSVYYILDGLKLINKPGIRQYVVIPLLINIVLFCSLLLISSHYFHAFDAWFANYLPSWLHWLASLLWIAFFLLFVTFFIYTFTLIGNLVSAPFNSLLAEKVELHLTGKTTDSRQTLEALRDLPHTLMRQLRIIGYYLSRAALLLILFCIPFLQPLAAALWFMFNAWFMTLQYLEYPADNQRVALSDVHTAMKKHRTASLGFGFGILVFSMIPGFNFFVMPAAVAGATKAWIEMYRNNQT